MTTFDREIEALRAKRDRAVTRPEVERLVGTGGGGSSAWADITGKPSTFTPSPHVHASSDITDLTEVVQDIVAALLVQGSGVTLTYNDAAGTLTVAASGGGLADGDKGDITVSGSGATWTIDANAVSLSKLATMATDSFLGRDTAGTGNVEVLSPSQVRVILNVADGATANASDASLRDRSTHTGTQLAATISDFASAVAALITGKANTVHTHVISDTTGLQTALDGKAATSHTHTAANITDFSEAVDDRVAALLVAGANITLTYDDVANTLTIASTGGGGGAPQALAWVI